MAVSKEAVSIVEALAYKIHEVERHAQRLQLGEDERNELRVVFDGLKAQIGRFFMKHVDRRSTVRSTSTIEDNYKSYWGLEKREKSVGLQEFPTHTSCRFCGSLDIKERRNNATGEVYWYCNTCRQENRMMDSRKKKL